MELNRKVTLKKEFEKEIFSFALNEKKMLDLITDQGDDFNHYLKNLFIDDNVRKAQKRRIKSLHTNIGTFDRLINGGVFRIVEIHTDCGMPLPGLILASQNARVVSLEDKSFTCSIPLDWLNFED